MVWIANALLILVAWTAIGFVVALLFFRLGFGFDVPPGHPERAWELPRPERERRTPAEPSRVPAPAGLGVAADGAFGPEPLVARRLEHARPLKAAG